MGVDGGVTVGIRDLQDSRPELEWAAREAVTRNRQMHVVHAYEQPSRRNPWDQPGDHVSTSELEQAAERRLASVRSHISEAWPSVDVTYSAVRGDAAEVLVKLSGQASLTVLGSERMGKVGAILGSIGTHVAARASGPVLVVKQAPRRSVGRIDIVVGVDGSGAADDALGFAFDYADRHKRALRAVYCWPPEQDPWSEPDAGEERAERWLAMSIAGWQERFPDVSVIRSIVRDHPASGLVRAASDSELVVVGNHGKHDTLPGSVTQSVVHHARGAVAIVPARAPSA